MKTVVAAAALLLSACALRPPAAVLLQGETMGSAWTVKVADALPMPPREFAAQVQARFDAVDQSLSTYRADSALSRFNDDESGGWIEIDPELAVVLRYALSLAGRSAGAYDVTVAPLVDIWGFGPDPASHSVPDAAAIAQARARVGWRKVEVDAAASRARQAPGVRVDLSSLGKGRGVDRVADYLDSAGVSNYLIDLSGKLRARGRNPQGNPWRVAVEQPGADNAVGTPAIVTLRNASVASAGDYRRYFEVDGHHYSHIIDPHTGYPVVHSTVSATAFGATCMEADALATVLMVMPPADALRLANETDSAALIIARDRGTYRLDASAAWRTE
jgi:thiamine biosynthesis lipoprotein